MSVQVFSFSTVDSCKEKVNRVFAGRKIEDMGSDLIIRDGRCQLYLVLEAWGPLDGVRSSVSIHSTVLKKEGEDSSLALDDLEKERLGEMVRLAVATLDTKEYWQDDRGVISEDSL